MVKKKIIWTKRTHSELYETLDYYTNRNKSRIYSEKLYKEIQQRLRKLDFSIVLPQKTSKPNIFYFTYKHVSVFFSFQENTIFVKALSNDRRNPKSIELVLRNLE